MYEKISCLSTTSDASQNESASPIGKRWSRERERRTEHYTLISREAKAPVGLDTAVVSLEHICISDKYFELRSEFQIELPLLFSLLKYML